MIIKDFFSSLKSYIRAHDIIFKNKLWPYLLIPGIMSVVYIFVLLLLSKIYLADISAYVMEHWIPEFMKGSYMSFITQVILWFAFVLTALISYKHVVMVIFSPLLATLSQVVEQIVYNNPAPAFSWNQFFKDIIRGLVINIRIIFMTILLSIPAWIIVFIPIVGAIISPLLLLWIQAYYGGFGLVDYTLERKMYPVNKSVLFVHSHKSAVTSLGLWFTLLMMIPIIGWIAAPAYGTVAGTLVSLEKLYE